LIGSCPDSACPCPDLSGSGVSGLSEFDTLCLGFNKVYYFCGVFGGFDCMENMKYRRDLACTGWVFAYCFSRSSRNCDAGVVKDLRKCGRLSIAYIKSVLGLLLVELWHGLIVNFVV